MTVIVFVNFALPVLSSVVKNCWRRTWRSSKSSPGACLMRLLSWKIKWAALLKQTLIKF